MVCMHVQLKALLHVINISSVSAVWNGESKIKSLILDNSSKLENTAQDRHNGR